MSEEIKYIHGELDEAVKRMQELGDFERQVDASKKAGEVLNDALDGFEDGLFDSLKEETEDNLNSDFDNSEFSLG